MRMACKACEMCAVLVLLCLLHVVAPLNVPTGASVVCAFSGWVPPDGYVPLRLRDEANNASDRAPKTCKPIKPIQPIKPIKPIKTPCAPFRPWRQGIPWRQERVDRFHLSHHSVARTREVLNNSTVVAVASLMQDTKHENKLLQQEVTVQRQEIAGLRTHMSALQLEAELRDFWCKEFKEVRYVGNDTFVVAYTLRL